MASSTWTNGWYDFPSVTINGNTIYDLHTKYSIYSPPQPEPIMFTKEKPYGVVGEGSVVHGPYTEEQAQARADELSDKGKCTVFVMKVFSTVKPERKTLTEKW
jgi:hypothetical protein